MPLDPNALLALAAACAPSAAPTTLLAIARVESGLDPLAIGINGPKPGRVIARSASEATQLAEGLIAAGRSIDLGIAQLNVRNLDWLGLSVADAFDPCRNLSGASRVLAEGYRRARNLDASPQAALRTAISFYNTGDPERGFRNGYVRKVIAASGGEPMGAASPVARAVLPQPPVPGWDVFGQARLVRTSFVIKHSTGVQP